MAKFDNSEIFSLGLQGRDGFEAVVRGGPQGKPKNSAADLDKHIYSSNASLPKPSVTLNRYDTCLLIVAARKQRIIDFQDYAKLFADPAWDIILDLYLCHCRHSTVTVTSACIASGVAPTTALRWVANLEKAGLVSRQADPLDRRRWFLSLNRLGLSQVEDYLDSYGSWIMQTHQVHRDRPASA